MHMSVNHAERERRRGCLKRHADAENNGDAETLMDTFAPDAVMTYNGVPFATHEHILAAHRYMGWFDDEGAAFQSVTMSVDRESFTDEDIVVEGRVNAVHKADFLGFPPSGRPVELPFVTMYRFGADGRLTSERVVMNLGPLNPNHSPIPQLG